MSRWLEEAERLLAEARAPGRPEELVQRRLRWEDWETLRPEMAVFAAQEIRRRKWRGSRSRVVPGGIDAEDVANQVIGEVLSGKVRLALGWTRERLVVELKRLVSQRVRRLHALKETATTRGEWDVLPRNEAGKRVSVFRSTPDTNGQEARAAAELGEERDELRKRIEEYLSGEPELRALFGCLWAGMTKPGDMAEKLGMEERAVGRARKRLERRLARFARERGKTN